LQPQKRLMAMIGIWEQIDNMVADVLRIGVEEFLALKTFPQVHLLNEKKPNSKHNEPHKFCHAAAGLSYCPTVCHMGTSCAQVAVSHKQMESKLRTDLFVPSAPVGMQFIDRRRNVSIVRRSSPSTQNH